MRRTSPENNFHHLFWMKRFYNTDLEKTFRGSFVKEMKIGTHALLHSEMRPPPKPNMYEMRYVLGALTLHETGDFYEDLGMVIGSFDHLSLESDFTNDQRRCQRIAEHLLKQEVYLKMGEPKTVY